MELHKAWVVKFRQEFSFMHDIYCFVKHQATHRYLLQDFPEIHKK